MTKEKFLVEIDENNEVFNQELLENLLNTAFFTLGFKQRASVREYFDNVVKIKPKLEPIVPAGVSVGCSFRSEK